MIPKVFIREHIPEDLEGFVEWQTDSEFGELLSWLPRSREEAIKYFKESILQQSSKNRSEYFFAVVHSESEEYLGDVGLTVNENGVGDCGWFIRKKYQNKGVATKAVKELVRLAFQDLKLSSLTASCRKSNIASMRVMEKCDFISQRESEDRIWYNLTQ